MELLEQARLPVSHGVMKPDIVFFNEALPRNFFAWLRSDLETLDLLLVIGTSLRVAPVSDIVSKVDADVPAILINREVSRMYPALQFAVCLRTNAPGGDTLVLGALVCSCY
jgi:NAD-dependent SIR2 family protein deacetylase